MQQLTSTLTSTATSRIKIAAAVAACLAFSACGAIAEKVAEEGAERIIEAESGENIELDFDSGDGSFSLETEEGGFSLDEDGNFVVTDQDGSVFTGSASDDQLVVLDADGDSVLNVTGDGENGEISVQGDDGEVAYRVVTDIPAEWPSDVPSPEGLSVQNGTFLGADGGMRIMLLASASGDAIEYTKGYIQSVTAAGFTESNRFDSTEDGATTTRGAYTNDTWTLDINGYQEADYNLITITLSSTNI